MLVSAKDAYRLCHWLNTATNLPPNGDPSGWKLIFKPKFSGDLLHLNKDYAVILQNTSDQNLLAVVVLGTHDFFQQFLLEDLDIDNPVEFVNSFKTDFIENAKIASGAGQAFLNVLGLKETDDGSTFRDFLYARDWTTQSVLITGHSLGGTLASMLAPLLAAWILKEAPLQHPLPPNMQVFTFAPFAAGNQQFADYLDGSQQYQAHINLNDVVPNVWATTGDFQVNNIYNMYSKPGPAMPQDKKDELKSIVKKIPSGFNYIQTKNPKTFTYPIQPPNVPPDKQWDWEVGVQHVNAYDKQYL
jgi:hypothetical protein